MNTNLGDLLAALPEDDREADLLNVEEAQEQLLAIFADLAHRPVPVHSLPRLWTLGELSTQVALAYLALWLRQWFADADTRQRRVMETNLRVALKMIHRLGYLRGAAAKLGQLLGSLPRILPTEVVSTLDRLHAQAPPMHFSLLREMVRNELGKDPADLFETFEKGPFAAASIGQVHRATLKSGQRVAVKIQYPGIARAMAADVRNLMALVFPMRLSRGWQSLKAQCEAVRQMLEQEADYEREAQNMREARALFEPEDGIVIPRVYDEYSSTRVLTTEFVPGLPLVEFLAANPSQELRDEFGLKINRAWYRMYYAYRSYGDPHSGNYVFMDDGRLGVLDFGCIQHFSAEERAGFERAENVLDKQAPFSELLGSNEYVTSADLAKVERHWQWLMEPVRNPGPFDFGDESHLKRGMDSLQELLRNRYTASPPMYVYLYRSLFGLRVLCFRLRCRVDIDGLHKREAGIWKAREQSSS
jgi:predicted unusual protein kinase regulating ubiquinone biosynthesis (AarF/ABC1/UbiB family)